MLNTGAIEELNQHKGPKRENLTLQIHFWAREYHLSTISGVSDAVSVRQSTANIFSYSVLFKLSTHIQLWAFAYVRLLNKPYENEVAL